MSSHDFRPMPMANQVHIDLIFYQEVHHRGGRAATPAITGRPVTDGDDPRVGFAIVVRLLQILLQPVRTFLLEFVLGVGHCEMNGALLERITHVFNSVFTSIGSHPMATVPTLETVRRRVDGAAARTP